MSEITPDLTTPTFRAQLLMNQPQVLRWLEEELDGTCRETAVELAARYFATTTRWGETMPILESSRLSSELEQQTRYQGAGANWSAELPIVAEDAQQRSLARVLQTLVRVSQDCN